MNKPNRETFCHLSNYFIKQKRFDWFFWSCLQTTRNLPQFRIKSTRNIENVNLNQNFRKCKRTRRKKNRYSHALKKCIKKRMCMKMRRCFLHNHNHHVLAKLLSFSNDRNRENSMESFIINKSLRLSASDRKTLQTYFTRIKWVK